MPGACAGATRSLWNNGIQTGLSAPTKRWAPGFEKRLDRTPALRMLAKSTKSRSPANWAAQFCNTKLHLGQKLFIIDVFYCQ